MLYALKMCVLTVMVFLTASVAIFFAVMAMECKQFPWLMAGNILLSLNLLGACWYFLRSFRYIKHPDFNYDGPHTITGQGEYRKEYRD